MGVFLKGVVTAVSLGAAVITVSGAKNVDHFDHFDQDMVSSSLSMTYNVHMYTCSVLLLFKTFVVMEECEH